MELLDKIRGGLSVLTKDAKSLVTGTKNKIASEFKRGVEELSPLKPEGRKKLETLTFAAPTMGLKNVTQVAGQAIAKAAAKEARVVAEAGFARMEALKNAVKNVAGNLDDIVKVRKAGNGTLKITRAELEVMKQMGDLKPTVGERYLQNPIRVFEELGEGAKELFYRPVKVAENIAIETKNLWNKEFDNVIKGLPKGASERIMKFAISQEAGGEKILGKAKTPILTPKETQVYEYIRGRYDALLDELNEARAIVGKNPINKVTNYFTHIRDISTLEQMGFNPVTDDIESLLANKIHRNATAFQWAKKRTGALTDIETDAFNVFRKYQEKAIDHIKLTPAIAKIRELSRNIIPDTLETKLPQQLDNLSQEARKYKSAEEYIAAQGKIIYHSTDSSQFNAFDATKAAKGETFFNPLGDGLFLSSNKDFTTRFGKNTYEYILPKDAKTKIITDRVFRQREYPVAVRGTLKQLGIDYNKLDLGDKVQLNRLVENNPPIQALNEAEFVIKEDIAPKFGINPKPNQVKDIMQGIMTERNAPYDAVIYRSTDYALGNADEIIIPKDKVLNLKTKSQLTEIWNKANQAVETTKFKLQDVAPNAYKYISEWTDFVAGQKVQTPMPKIVENLVATLNKNMAFATLSYNLRSAVIQPSAIINTVTELGPKNTSVGIKELLRGQGKFALENSKVLNGRQFETAIKDMATTAYGKVARAKSAIAEAGIKPLQLLDSITAQATWLGAYNDAITRLGKSGQAAYNYADDIVTKTQASAARSDVAKLQRSTLGKVATQFQTFVINDFNRIFRDVLGVGNAKMKQADIIKKAVTYVGAVTLWNYVSEDVLGIPSPFPRPIKALKKGGVVEAGKELAGQVPVVGGAARYGSGLFGAALDTVTQGFNKASGKYTSQSWWEIAGKLFGVPGTAQLKKIIKGVDVIDGGYTVTTDKGKKIKIFFTDPVDKVRALLFGPYETKKAKETRESGKNSGGRKYKLTPPR